MATFSDDVRALIVAFRDEDEIGFGDSYDRLSMAGHLPRVEELRSVDANDELYSVCQGLADYLEQLMGEAPPPLPSQQIEELDPADVVEVDDGEVEEVSSIARVVVTEPYVSVSEVVEPAVPPLEQQDAVSSEGGDVDAHAPWTCCEVRFGRFAVVYAAHETLFVVVKRSSVHASDHPLTGVKVHFSSPRVRMYGVGAQGEALDDALDDPAVLDFDEEGYARFAFRLADLSDREAADGVDMYLHAIASDGDDRVQVSGYAGNGTRSHPLIVLVAPPALLPECGSDDGEVGSAGAAEPAPPPVVPLPTPPRASGRPMSRRTEIGFWAAWLLMIALGMGVYFKVHPRLETPPSTSSADTYESGPHDVGYAGSPVCDDEEVREMVRTEVTLQLDASLHEARAMMAAGAARYLAGALAEAHARMSALEAHVQVSEPIDIDAIAQQVSMRVFGFGHRPVFVDDPPDHDPREDYRRVRPPVAARAAHEPLRVEDILNLPQFQGYSAKRLRRYVAEHNDAFGRE